MRHSDTGFLCGPVVRYARECEVSDALEGWPSGLRRWFAKPSHSLSENPKITKISAFKLGLCVAHATATSAQSAVLEGL